MYDLAEEKIKKRTKEMISELKHLKKEKKELQAELDTMMQINQLLDEDKYEKYQKITIEISQLDDGLKKLQSEDKALRHETFYSMLEKEKRIEIEAFQVAVTTNDPLAREYGKQRLEEISKELSELKKSFSYLDSLKEEKKNLEILMVERKNMGQLKKELTSKYRAVVDLRVDELSNNELFQVMRDLKKASAQILDKISILHLKLESLQIEGIIPLSQIKQPENPVVKTQEDGVNAINRYKKVYWIAQNNSSKYYSFLDVLIDDYTRVETKKFSFSEKNKRTEIVKKVIHILEKTDEFIRNSENNPSQIPIAEVVNVHLPGFKQGSVGEPVRNKVGVKKEGSSFSGLSIISEQSYESEGSVEKQKVTTSKISLTDSQITSRSLEVKDNGLKQSEFEKKKNNASSSITGSSNQHMETHLEKYNYSAFDSLPIFLESDSKKSMEITDKKLSEADNKLSRLFHTLKEVDKEIKREEGKNLTDLLNKKEVIQSEIELLKLIKENLSAKLVDQRQEAKENLSAKLVDQRQAAKENLSAKLVDQRQEAIKKATQMNGLQLGTNVNRESREKQ